VSHTATPAKSIADAAKVAVALEDEFLGLSNLPPESPRAFTQTIIGVVGAHAG